MLLSIIIPVYNEELTIGDIIDRVKAVMQQTGLKTEIIVVDDHSYDRSLEVAKERTASNFTRLSSIWAKAMRCGRVLLKQKAT